MGKSEGNAELRKVKLEKRAQNTTDDDEADKPSGGPDHDTDNYSDVESDVTEPDFDQEETYDVDAIKYAEYKDTTFTREDGFIGWHYGVMWRGYLKSMSDTEEPYKSFPDHKGKAPMVRTFWNAVGRKIPFTRREPGGKLGQVVEAPKELLKHWFKETEPRRDYKTYKRRRAKELAGEEITKGDSDYYWRKRRKKENARQRANGELPPKAPKKETDDDDDHDDDKGKGNGKGKAKEKAKDPKDGERNGRRSKKGNGDMGPPSVPPTQRSPHKRSSTQPSTSDSLMSLFDEHSRATPAPGLGEAGPGPSTSSSKKRTRVESPPSSPDKRKKERKEKSDEKAKKLASMTLKKNPPILDQPPAHDTTPAATTQQQNGTHPSPLFGLDTDIFSQLSQPSPSPVAGPVVRDQEPLFDFGEGESPAPSQISSSRPPVPVSSAADPTVFIDSSPLATKDGESSDDDAIELLTLTAPMELPSSTPTEQLSGPTLTVTEPTPLKSDQPEPVPDAADTSSPPTSKAVEPAASLVLSPPTSKAPEQPAAPRPAPPPVVAAVSQPTPGPSGTSAEATLKSPPVKEHGLYKQPCRMKTLDVGIDPEGAAKMARRLGVPQRKPPGVTLSTAQSTAQSTLPPALAPPPAEASSSSSSSSTNPRRPSVSAGSMIHPSRVPLISPINKVRNDIRYDPTRRKPHPLPTPQPPPPPSQRWGMPGRHGPPPPPAGIHLAGQSPTAPPGLLPNTSPLGNTSPYGSSSSYGAQYGNTSPYGNKSPHGGGQPPYHNKSPYGYQSPFGGDHSPAHANGGNSPVHLQPPLGVVVAPSYSAARDPRLRNQANAANAAQRPTSSGYGGQPPAPPLSPPRLMGRTKANLLWHNNKTNAKDDSVELTMTTGANRIGDQYLVGVMVGREADFNERPIQCISMALAQGAHIDEWSRLGDGRSGSMVMDARSGSGDERGDEKWERFKKRTRQTHVVWVAQIEVQPPMARGHKFVVLGAASDVPLEAQVGLNGSTAEAIGLVAFVLSFPDHPTTLPMLPNPVRPDFVTGEKMERVPSAPTGGLSLAASYGMDDRGLDKFRNGKAMMYPNMPSSNLYEQIFSAFMAAHIDPPPKNKSPDATLLFNGQWPVVAKSSTVKGCLTLPTRFFAIGPDLELPAAYWQMREIWVKGGLVALTPSLILQNPDQVADIMELIRTAPDWDAYITPSTVLWLDESWSRADRCPDRNKAFATLTSAVFDGDIRGGRLAVTFAPPRDVFREECGEWLDWLRKVNHCTSWNDLVALCRTAHQLQRPSSRDRLSLGDIETAALADMRDMRVRPHIVPYRRFLCVGEVSLPSQERAKWTQVGGIDYVHDDDFAAVLAGKMVAE